MCPWSCSHWGQAQVRDTSQCVGQKRSCVLERVLKLSRVDTNHVTAVVKVQLRDFYLLFILFRKCNHLSRHLTSLILSGHVDREAAGAKPGSGWAYLQSLGRINNKGVMSSPALPGCCSSFPRSSSGTQQPDLSQS